MQVRSRLSQVKALVYDEADTLLDLGFGKDISQIRRLLTSNLQTFLFSATVPERLLRIAGEWMRPGYITVDTLNKEDAVHFNVIRQSYVKVPFMQQKQVLYHILDRHLHANPQGKVMIFCPTVRLTMWVAETINAVRGREVMVLHSKMSQPERTRIVRRFKAARSVIMATTDVSARGVDYDGIDLVIQLGVPRNIDSYTHRIGRTGRAGKTGEAILVLSPYEMPFLRHL
ncbi:P-loop containing nucleoside triphosphate hydrolase protein, partial [Caulochytrium protostelioides]